jgi:hypothetical protein
MPKRRLALGIGVAVVAAVAVFLLIDGGDSDGGSSASKQARPETRGPVVVSLASLRDLADSVGHPVYWAGEREDSYELTVDANANIFIRYLKQGEPAGSRRETSLTIGTYPYADAFETLRSASRRPGMSADHTPDGGLVVAGKANPHNAYIAYPDRDYQIEIYDPRGGRALALATKGAISPVR